MSFLHSSLIRTLLLAAILCLPRLAMAEPVVALINNGASANRINIVIMGDGYTAAEMDKYAADAQQFVQAFFAQEPFKEYQKYFNVYRLDVISNQSGASHPERVPAVIRNTAFGSTYNCSNVQRLICADFAKVITTAQNNFPPNQRDMIVVIVNDSEYGGSGGTFAVVSTNESAPEIALHEIGHSFGLLADEYGGPPPPFCNSTVEPPEANATKATKRGQIKWNAWIDPNTPLPTPPNLFGVPGLFPGAKYCDDTLFRPTIGSKMRILGAPYEQINTEQLIKRIYNFVSPVDSIDPPPSTIQIRAGQSRLFSAVLLTPISHALSVTWLVDNQPQGSGPTFMVASSALSEGSHTLELIVKDTTTSVRNDPDHVLTLSQQWTIFNGDNVGLPRITGVTIEGKNLLITGERFQSGAVLEIDGNPYDRTKPDPQSPTTMLIAKKAAKQIERGATVTLFVKNPDGTISPPFPYTRPAQ